MKKLLRISSTLVLIVFILICHQSCNSKTESTSTEPKALAENEITEAKLAKGKYVIEEPARPVERPIVVTPVSGNNPKKNEPNNSAAKHEDTRKEKLQKKYKNLVVFHADDTMEVNKPKLVVLVLARNESEENVKKEVFEESGSQNPKVKTDTTMDFGSKMRAKLIGFSGTETDFEIQPLGDEEQSFKADRRKVIWQWKITPQKAGQHELKLTIQIIEKDGEAVSLPARNIPVLIFAKSEKFMDKVGNFFATKYEWIVTAVLIPVIIAIVNIRMRNKNKQNQVVP